MIYPISQWIDEGDRDRDRERGEEGGGEDEEEEEEGFTLSDYAVTFSSKRNLLVFISSGESIYYIILYYIIDTIDIDTIDIQ